MIFFIVEKWVSDDPIMKIKSWDLRRNMTDAERRLWYFLEYEPYDVCEFKRQVPMGRYIVDFVSFKKKLIIEVDGGHHAEQEKYDEKRTGWLNAHGFEVIRFWNEEVFDNLDGVLEVIWDKVFDED